MTQDIATLGIAIDSGPVKGAASDLERLLSVGTKVEGGIQKMVRAAKDFGQGFSQGAREAFREYVSGASRLSEASTRAESDIRKVTKAAREQSVDISGLMSMIRRYAAMVGVAFSAREIIQMADAYSNMSARLLLATGSSEKFAAAQEALSKIANDTRTGLESSVNLFAQLTRSTEALGVSQKDVLRVTETINKAMAVSGTSAQGAQAALVQLGQAFAAGALRGDELNSILEQSPRLARAIAEGMDVSVGALRKLGSEGKLTGEKVFEALQKSASKIDQEFSRLPLTVGGATTQLRNAFFELVGQFNEGSGASTVLAEAIQSVAQWLRELRKEVKNLSESGELQRWMDDFLDGFEQAAGFVKVLISSFEVLDAAARRWNGATITRDIEAWFNPEIKKQIESEEKALHDSIDKLQREWKSFNSVTIGDRSLRRRLGMLAEEPAAPSDSTSAKRLPDTDKNAARIAKAMRDAEIADIRNGLNELTAAYSAAETILEAKRSAGIISEKDYYEAKRAFIAMDSEAQIRAIELEQERLRAEKVTGVERIKVQSEIAKNASRIEQIRVKATANIEALGVKEVAANAAVKRSYEEARIAAQDYLDELVLRQRRELDALGMSDRQRERVAGLNQIDDQYRKKRDDLEQTKALLDMERKWTDEAQRNYETRLAIIDEYNQKARESYEKAWQERDARDSDAMIGATRALNNYLDVAKNVSKQVEDAVTSAFKNMEDALVQFVTTGKIDFRSLANSILADIARIEAKRFISSLIGSTSGAGFGSSIVSLVSSIFGGGRADGGPVEAGKAYLVGEKGVPELFWPGMSGQITQAGGVNVNIRSVISAAPGTDPAALKTYLDYRDNQLKADILDGMRRGRYAFA